MAENFTAQLNQLILKSPTFGFTAVKFAHEFNLLYNNIHLYYVYITITNSRLLR